VSPGRVSCRNIYQGSTAANIYDSAWALEDVAVGEYFVALLHDGGLISGAGDGWSACGVHALTHALTAHFEWRCRPRDWPQAAPAMDSLRFGQIVASPGHSKSRVSLLCGVTIDRRRALCTGWQSTDDFRFSNFW
jgi:hypothetical protein